MSGYVLGTEIGLLWLYEKDGEWKIDSDLVLKGKDVVCGVNSNDRLIVTSYDDGVYISNDYGVSWKRVNDNRLVRVRCLKRAVWNGRDILFAGTEPVALYFSDDAGESWKEISGVRKLHEVRKWCYPVPGVGPHVRDVIVDEQGGDLLYVAIQVGGILVGSQRGERWEEKTVGLNLDVHRILIDPSDRSIIYAATGEEGIFVTKDLGDQWIRCGAEFPWTYTLPFAIRGPRRLIAGMGKGLPGDWIGRESGAEAVVAVSQDGGTNWVASYPSKPLYSMIMDIIFASSERSSVIVATGVPIGGIVKGSGELYWVDIESKHWVSLAAGLPGINVVMASTN